jgi:hypothetical protein
MPNVLYRWIEPHATPRVLGLGALLWIGSALGVLAFRSRVTARTGGLPLPDVRPFYAPGDLYTLLEQYGELGRRAFLEFTLYDILYPCVAYGVAALVLAALMRSLVEARAGWASIIVLPLAGLVVELLEQAGFLASLALFPARVPALASAVSVLTLVKFVLIAALVSSLGGLALWRALVCVRRPARR